MDVSVQTKVDYNKKRGLFAAQRCLSFLKYVFLQLYVFGKVQVCSKKGMPVIMNFGLNAPFQTLNVNYDYPTFVRN